MASPALSQASTAFESDAPQIHDAQKAERRAALQRAKEAATSQDILWFLTGFRILNALSIRTFFQPDEYYQSLEPAWEIAFGAGSGAWITWVRAIVLLITGVIANLRFRNGRTNFDLPFTLPSSPGCTILPPSCRMHCDSVPSTARNFYLLRRKLHRP